MRALARVPLARLTRSRRAWLGVAGWVLLAIASAIVARTRGQTSGADQVMRGALGVVVLPLVSYVIVAAALGGGGLRRSIRGVVTLGASPRDAAAATIAVSAIAAAVVGGVVSAGVCALAHGPADPPLARDAFASLWVGALAGAAYAAYFSAGSAIGNGAMRGVLLAIDWVLGSASGFGALFTPRAHVSTLLGGAPAFELPARASSVLLVLLAVLWGALALLLGRRAPR